MDKWRYICLEGPDLVGKTTMAERIQSWLTEVGVESRIAPQPGSTNLGVQLRHIIKHDKRIAIGKETEAMVFVLDQMAFVENILLEARENGVWVISDRNNYISGLIYQVLNGVDPKRLDHFYSVIETPKMDMILLLQAPPPVLKDRVKKRCSPEKWDRYESNTDFMERVYAAYGRLLEEHLVRLSFIADSCMPIDASADEEAVFAQIEEQLKKLL
jgi:dTMP kinase